MRDIPNPDAACYSLSFSPADLVIERWGSVATVYQRQSGETHVFNHVTAAFLECLRERPGTIDAVVKRVARVLDMSEDEVPSDNFVSVVARLEELGLVRKTSERTSD